MELKDKVVIVTGALGSLGRAVSAAAAKAGAKVYAVDVVDGLVTFLTGQDVAGAEVFRGVSKTLAAVDFILEDANSAYARQVTNGKPKEIVVVQLLNYVEDIIAQTVGFEQVGTFIQNCILQLPQDRIADFMLQ